MAIIEVVGHMEPQKKTIYIIYLFTLFVNKNELSYNISYKIVDLGTKLE